MSGVADSGRFVRPLPASSSALALSSAAGRELFKEALEEGGMEVFFSLVEQLHARAEPSFCGLNSLSVVLRAMGLLRGPLSTAPWRFVGDEAVDCCAALDDEERGALTLERLASFARPLGARVKRFSAAETTAAELRYSIKTAARSPSGTHVVVSYSRLGSAHEGARHYCPIGGYSVGRDRVLLLDVAPTRYPPHWVALDALWEAMDGLPDDPGAQSPHGFLFITSADAPSRP